MDWTYVAGVCAPWPLIKMLLEISLVLSRWQFRVIAFKVLSG